MTIPYYKDPISIGNRPVTAAWQETSGIAAGKRSGNEGILWMASDGSGTVLHTLRISDNVPRGEYTLQGATPSDKEDIATATINGTSYLYVADSGDNANARATFNIYRVIEPLVGAANVNLVAGTDYITIVCQYPSPPTHKDAETIFIDPDTGDIYIVLKRVTPAPLYRLPHAATYTGTQTLELVGTIATPDPKTWGGDDGNSATAGGNGGYYVGGDMNQAGNMIILKSYTTAYIFEKSSSQTILEALQETPVTLEQYGGGLMSNSSPNLGQAGGMHPGMEPKGEGICFDVFENIFTASEFISGHGSGASAYPTFKIEKLSLPYTEVTFQDGLNSYAGTSDTTIHSLSGNQNLNSGNDTTFIADYNSGTDERYGLLKFDISSIPANATIVGADLWITIQTEGLQFQIRKMYQNWTESSTYTSLGGLPAFDDVDAASVVDAAHTNYNTRVGPVKSKIPLSTIQDWIDGSLTNNGWVIYNNTTEGDGLQFHSSEAVTQGNRPKLVIRYTLPISEGGTLLDDQSILLPNTAYPSQGGVRSGNRTPYAFISGTIINNNNAVIGTGRSGVQKHLSNIGSQVIDNAESGHIAATNEVFPNLSTTLRKGLSNISYPKVPRFQIDRDRPSRTIGWNYVTGQPNNTFHYFELSADLVVNGGMNSNLDGWYLSGGSIWVSDYGGSAELQNGQVIRQLISVDANSLYRMRITNVGTANDVGLYIIDSTLTNVIASEVHVAEADHTTHESIFNVGNNASVWIYIRNDGDAGDLHIKNVSFCKVQKDIQSTFGNEALGATYLIGGKVTTNKRF